MPSLTQFWKSEIKQLHKKKSHQNWKGKSKTMTSYTENPKDFTKKLLKLINKFSKGTIYKISTKNLFCFCMLIANYQKNPFIIISKRIKLLGINLTQELRDLFTENQMTLMKEIEEDTNIQEGVAGSWIGSIDIIKMSILLKVTYRFSAITVKIHRNKKNNPKICMEP